MALFAPQQGVRGGSRGKDEVLPCLKAQLMESSHYLPSRLAGGIGHVAVGDPSLFETVQGFEGTRYRSALGVERSVEVYEQALYIHKKSAGLEPGAAACAYASYRPKNS